MGEKIAALRRHPLFSSLVQFIKFGIVGLSNTAISYGIDMLCYYVLFAGVKFSFILRILKTMGIAGDSDAVRVVITTLIAFVISVTNSYFWNNRFVFGDGEKKKFSAHIKPYAKTFACYGITGLVMAPILKVVFTNYGMPYWLAGFVVLIITIPLNFLLNKFWAFGKKEEKKT